MDVVAIQVPYHLGHGEGGLAAGVAPLAEAVAAKPEVVRVERGGPLHNEIAASFDVVRALATRVRQTRGFPLVLAANCHSSLGTVAGLRSDVGVVWFDAHGDFNTPDTTESGFFDGMALAMLTGSGWRVLRESVEGLRPVPEERVVLVGARDLDEPEREQLDASRIARPALAELPQALDALRELVDAVYVHVDLDVLDPSVGRANWFAADDGLLLPELLDAIDAIAERFTIRAAALTAYAPECDPERAIPAAAREIARHLTRSAVTA
jgi:arginase